MREDGSQLQSCEINSLFNPNNWIPPNDRVTRAPNNFGRGQRRASFPYLDDDTLSLS